LPEKVWQRIQADAGLVALAESVRQQFQDGRLPDGFLNDVAQQSFRLRLMDGRWDKIRFFWNRLQPTVADREAIRIPAPLFPVYYIVRPVRLAGKWWRAGRTKQA
jgi:hypothetical protein